MRCIASSVPISCWSWCSWWGLVHVMVSWSWCLSWVILLCYCASGSDLVDWLNTNVEGFIDRRHARKYAALMLKVCRGSFRKIVEGAKVVGWKVWGGITSLVPTLHAVFGGWMVNAPLCPLLNEALGMTLLVRKLALFLGSPCSENILSHVLMPRVDMS